MDDLISRKAMREAMYREAMEKDSDEQKWDGGCWIRYKMFERVIESVPSEPQWIPVEVRPPKFGKDVLISYRNGVCVDWLTQSEGNAYFFISGVAIQDIDAWMPLPEPYKENRNDER